MVKNFISGFRSIKKSYALAFIISLIFVMGEVYLLWSAANLPPQVPFWYSKTWGENQLTTPNWLWLIPAVTGVFLLVNAFLCYLISNKEPTVASITIWSTTIISFAATLTLYRILMVVLP